jgi:hypothetical protein
MKFLFRTIFFHFVCIVIFTVLYYNFSNDYDNNNNNNNKNHDSFLDFLLLSTTIQAGVGISGLYPINDIGKIIMILQQMLLLSSHIITLYVFTL